MSDIETHQLLGSLIAKMDGLASSAAESEQQARESREKVYQALEDIRADAQASRTRLDSIEDTLEKEVKPVVRGVLDWRSRAIGAAAVLGLIGSMVVIAFTAAKELLLDVWRLMVSR